MSQTCEVLHQHVKPDKSLLHTKCRHLSVCLPQGRWESQQDIFMPSQFQRTLPRPASSPSTYSTSPSSSPTPFATTPPQQEPEQGKPSSTPPLLHHHTLLGITFFFSSWVHPLQQLFFLPTSSALEYPIL